MKKVKTILNQWTLKIAVLAYIGVFCIFINHMNELSASISRSDELVKYAGGSFNDSSPNLNNLVPTGNVALSSSGPSAFVFNGGTAESQRKIGYTPTGSVTTAFWIFYDPAVVSSGNVMDTHGAFTVSERNGSLVFSDTYMAAGKKNAEYVNIPMSPGWNHVAVVYAIGRQISVHVNGELRQAVPMSASSWNTGLSNLLTLGSSAFTRKLGDITVLNRDITTDEIAGLYSAQVDKYCLVSSFPLNGSLANTSGTGSLSGSTPASWMTLPGGGGGIALSGSKYSGTVSGLSGSAATVSFGLILNDPVQATANIASFGNVALTKANNALVVNVKTASGTQTYSFDNVFKGKGAYDLLVSFDGSKFGQITEVTVKSNGVKMHKVKQGASTLNPGTGLAIGGIDMPSVTPSPTPTSSPTSTSITKWTSTPIATSTPKPTSSSTPAPASTPSPSPSTVPNINGVVTSLQVHNQAITMRVNPFSATCPGGGGVWGCTMRYGGTGNCWLSCPNPTPTPTPTPTPSAPPTCAVGQIQGCTNSIPPTCNCSLPPSPPTNACAPTAVLTPNIAVLNAVVPNTTIPTPCTNCDQFVND